MTVAAPKLPPFVELLSKVEAVEFAEDWYAFNTTEHFWFEWRFRAFQKLIASIQLPADRNLRVLDIGCGTGVVRTQVEGWTAWTVDATDLNLGALALIKPGRGRTFYYDILARRSELEAQYDAVILFDVIEHLETTKDFLQAAAFHLKPGGVLLVNVPALESLRSVYDTVVGHFRRYDAPMMDAEMKTAGINVVEMRYWGWSMAPLLWMRKKHLRDKEGLGAASVVRSGFQPPGRAAHALLKAVMTAECALVDRPPYGSSLLMAGRKPL